MGIAVHTSRTVESFHGLTSLPRSSTGPERAEAVAAEPVETAVAGRQPHTPRTAAQTDPATQPNTPPAPTSAEKLDATAQRVLQALRQRDREVRQHEQAHLLAAGKFATGGPQYSYQTGPDGHRYAVGGEVPIDLSTVPGDPEATIQKALTIRRAALAPVNPSGPDLAVAAKAASLATQAQQELTKLQSTQRSAAAEAAGEVAQDDEYTVATPLAPHVCGPNCQEHDLRPASEAPQAVSGGLASVGVLASRAVEFYQRASRIP